MMVLALTHHSYLTLYQRMYDADDADSLLTYL